MYKGEFEVGDRVKVYCGDTGEIIDIDFSGQIKEVFIRYDNGTEEWSDIGDIEMAYPAPITTREWEYIIREEPTLSGIMGLCSPMRDAKGHLIVHVPYEMESPQVVQIASQMVLLDGQGNLSFPEINCEPDGMYLTTGILVIPEGWDEDETI